MLQLNQKLSLPHQLFMSLILVVQRLERGVSKDCWECGPTVSKLPGFRMSFLSNPSSVLPVSWNASTHAKAARAIIAFSITKDARRHWYVLCPLLLI